MQTRQRLRSRPNPNGVDTGDTPGNCIEDVDMSEVLEHLEDVDRLSSRRQEQSAKEAQECLDQLANAGFFSSPEFVPSAVITSNAVELVQDNVGALETEWKGIYEKRKTAWKQHAVHCETDDIGGTVSLNSAANISAVPEDTLMINNVGDVLETPMLLQDGAVLIKNVAPTWTLNKEQEWAFEIVATLSWTW